MFSLDELSLTLFDAVANLKGYSFVQVVTQKQYREAKNLYDAEGFVFPERLQAKVTEYGKGAVSFLAYYRDRAVGMVRLGNPAVMNRPFELYGVDETGECFEVQSLLVKKQHRDSAQFVMLGLFRAMYSFSLKQGIRSWSSCGSNSVYLTVRRFCKDLKVTEIDFASIEHPLTQYLFEQKIIETYFTMNVAGFSPWGIFRKCMKKLIKKIRVSGFVKLSGWNTVIGNIKSVGFGLKLRDSIPVTR